MAIDTFVRVTEPMERQLRLFLSHTHARCDWLEDDIMKVFLRKSYRRIWNERVWTMDIANVVVTEKYRGKGYFRAFIQKSELLLRELRPDLVGIYIENVQQERFRDSLPRMGFDGVSSSGWQEGIVDCFFSPLPMGFGSCS